MLTGSSDEGPTRRPDGTHRQPACAHLRPARQWVGLGPLPDGGAAPWPARDSEPPGPLLYPFAGGAGPHSFISRWWTWPLPPAGPLEFVCEWPAFGIAESRAGIDARLVLDAARRSIRLWPESEG